MGNIEIPRIPPPIERLERERLRNRIFDQLVAARVLDTLSEELEDAHFDAATVAQIEETFAELSESDKRAVLAIPAQLRPNLFKRYREQVSDGLIDGRSIIADILSKANRYGFTLGFHLSPHDIRPEKDGSWNIRGTERDHRHNDLPMAYYSTDYAHRYLKKPVRFLYVIRAETGEHTSHYPDNDGTWGHASSLAIVDSIDMHELEQEMDRKLKLMEATQKGDA